MTAQRLPLPIGSLHPVRTRVRTRRGRVRRSGRAAIAAVGVAAAGAGVLLAASPPPTTVEVDPAAYHLGAVSFPARGGGVYSGRAGALVIVESGSRIEAGAATNLDGVRMLGSCTYPAGAAVERCHFTVGASSLDAVDHLDHGGWNRRYDDGRAVRIELAGGRPAPVPFALGR